MQETCSVAEVTAREARHLAYEALCEKRDAARAEHRRAEGDRDIAARVIADYVVKYDWPIVEAQRDDYRQKQAEVDRLRSAWFDCRDEVETFMGRPVMKR